MSCTCSLHYYYYKCQDYSDTITKKCCRGTVQNVMPKFAVNAVQQIDSAIMSGLQRMPWIAVFSAGDETPSTSTIFWPTKAMHSRPVQRPLEKHGHQWLVALTARVVSLSIQTWGLGMQGADVQWGWSGDGDNLMSPCTSSVNCLPLTDVSTRTYYFHTVNCDSGDDELIRMWKDYNSSG